MIVYGDDGIVCRMVLHTGRIIAHMLAFMHLLQTHTDTPHWNWFRSIFLLFSFAPTHSCVSWDASSSTHVKHFPRWDSLSMDSFSNQQWQWQVFSIKTARKHRIFISECMQTAHMHKHTHTHHRNQRLQCDLKNAEWAAIITVILFFLFSSFFFRKDFPFCEWSNTKWHSNMLITLYENYSSIYAHMHSVCVRET